MSLSRQIFVISQFGLARLYGRASYHNVVADDRLSVVSSPSPLFSSDIPIFAVARPAHVEPRSDRILGGTPEGWQPDAAGVTISVWTIFSETKGDDETT